MFPFSLLFFIIMLEKLNGWLRLGCLQTKTTASSTGYSTCQMAANASSTSIRPQVEYQLSFRPYLSCILVRYCRLRKSAKKIQLQLDNLKLRFTFQLFWTVLNFLWEFVLNVVLLLMLLYFFIICVGIARIYHCFRRSLLADTFYSNFNSTVQFTQPHIAFSWFLFVNCIFPLATGDLEVIGSVEAGESYSIIVSAR